jgi:hypothetical protein
MDLGYLISGLPAPLRRVLINELRGLRPQRKTDVWYEDEHGEVWAIRKQAEAFLPGAAAVIWKDLNAGKTVEGLAETLLPACPGRDLEEIVETVAVILLNATLLDLIELYPVKFSTENLHPLGPG